MSAVMVGWPQWTAQKNDLVGGYIVTTYPYSYAAHDHREGGDPQKCGYIVAECMTLEDAVQIAGGLNAARYVPPQVAQNLDRWRWVQAGYLEGTLRCQ